MLTSTHLARRTLVHRTYSPFPHSQRWISSSPDVPKRRFRSRLVAFTLASAFVGFGTYLVWPSPSRRARVSASLPLSPFHFTPVTVESSEPNPLDPTTKIITLRVPPELLPSDKYSLRTVHSIYIKDDDIQVERPYTPLYGIEKEGEAIGRAVLWIKRYPHGEVGRWLHSKRPSDQVEIRAPVTTWDYVKEMENHKWDEIIMVCLRACV